MLKKMVLPVSVLAAGGLAYLGAKINSGSPNTTITDSTSGNKGAKLYNANLPSTVYHQGTELYNKKCSIKEPEKNDEEIVLFRNTLNDFLEKLQKFFGVFNNKCTEIIKHLNNISHKMTELTELLDTPPNNNKTSSITPDIKSKCKALTTLFTQTMKLLTNANTTI
jgi:hypothetical protein